LIARISGVRWSGTKKITPVIFLRQGLGSAPVLPYEPRRAGGVIALRTKVLNR
jgi:hypothetical protein